MSSKLGLILSMVFVCFAFLFGVDLIALQASYSALDSKANNISYLISRHGVVNQSFINYIESTFNVDFICDQYLAPSFGEKITYRIVSFYQPIVIGKEAITLAIERMTIVGFYG